MYRTDYLGGCAEYLFPITINNPDYGKPFSDPAYTALRSAFRSDDVKIASLRRAASAAELFQAFPEEQVIAVATADTIITPKNRDWDPRKNNWGGEKIPQMGWVPHNHAITPALMRFDLACFPRNAEIAGAMVRFTLMGGWGKVPLKWEACALRRSWTENGACYMGPEGADKGWGKEGAEDPSADFLADTAVRFDTPLLPRDGQTKKTIAFDVTDLVKQWHAGRLANNGLIIRPVGVTEAFNDISFLSSEFEDFPFRPTLVVAYKGGDPVSAVKGSPPSFPGTESAAPEVKAAPAAEEKPAPKAKPKAAAAQLPEGFCWLMTMDGQKIPAKILQYDGDRFQYQTVDGKTHWGSRTEMAVVCP